MNNFNYEKKYHYWVKYFVIAFPLLILLFIILNHNIIVSDIENYFLNFSQILEVPVNSWYFDIIDLIGFRDILDSGSIYGVLICYPLYVFWVYVFDLILDVFTFVPKLAHKLMKKLGG